MQLEAGALRGCASVQRPSQYGIKLWLFAVDGKLRSPLGRVEVHVFAHKDSCMRVAVNGDALSFDVGDMAGGRVYIVCGATECPAMRSDITVHV